MMNPLLVVAAAVLSFLLCWGVIHLPLKDAPDGERKTQKAPVPTAGGLGIAVAIAVVSAVFLLNSGFTLGELAGRFVGQGDGAVLAIAVCVPILIGFFDDWRGMPALVKLVLLFGWCIGAVWAISDGTTPFETVTGFAVFAAIAFALFVFTNAANFMDGSNGLAVGCLAIMILALFGPLSLGQWCWDDCSRHFAAEYAVFLTVMIPSACLGFLAWNIPGRLYVGDTGALGLGAAFGFLSIRALDSWAPPQIMVWFVLTLALPFLVDVGMTLGLRSFQGKNILRAHTEHAYQGLIASGWRHWQVAWLWWGFTLFCAASAYGGLYLQIQVAFSPNAIGPSFWVFVALALTGAVIWTGQRFVLLKRVSAPG